MKYINIDKNLIPYRFEIVIKNETYEFVVNYNRLHDFFTIDLYKNDVAVVLGERLIYGKPLFVSCLYKDIPKAVLIPYDASEKADRITFENMNEQVFLYLIEDDENGTL